MKIKTKPICNPKKLNYKIKNDIKLFEEKQLRTIWSEEEEELYFSIVDVIEVLTKSIDAGAYWRKLKQSLKTEGNETVTNCYGLKMLTADGKMRLTDVATTQQLFRLIQSIPSPKAEPFKLWLAQIANDRINEMQDPELTIDRAMEQYLNLGYSENWIYPVGYKVLNWANFINDSLSNGGKSTTKKYRN